MRCHVRKLNLHHQQRKDNKQQWAVLAKLSSVWNWSESLQTYIIQNTRKGVFKNVRQVLTSWKLFNEFPDLRNGIQPEGVVSPHRTCVIWKEAIWERIDKNIMVQTFLRQKEESEINERHNSELVEASQECYSEFGSNKERKTDCWQGF